MRVINGGLRCVRYTSPLLGESVGELKDKMAGYVNADGELVLPRGQEAFPDDYNIRTRVYVLGPEKLSKRSKCYRWDLSAGDLRAIKQAIREAYAQ